MDLIRAVWRKSSFSNHSGAACVEVADVPLGGANRLIAVRDSKDPEGPALTFADGAWRQFVSAVKSRDFD